MVAEYLAAHADVLAVPTLIRRLATISKTHALRGHENPTNSNLVRTVMRGIRRTHGHQPHQKAAVLTEQIIAMVENIGTRPKDLRDRALLLIGFAGGFRRSELVALKCTDIEWAAKGVIINLRRSKCDQEGIGRQVVIPCGHGTCCPVRALDNWLSTAGIEAGSLFRAVNRHSHIAQKALSPEAVALVIKARAKAAGMDPRRYSGHSLRAGLATSAAAAGVPSWKIRRQTGHASEVMLERYIRDGNRFEDNAAAGLL
jgi:integrase